MKEDTNLKRISFGIAFCFFLISVFSIIAISEISRPSELMLAAKGFFTIYLAIIAFLCIRLIKSKLDARRIELAPCEHGIAGGKWKKLCPVCEQRMREVVAEEKRRRDEHEWNLLVQKSANELAVQETTRLSSSIKIDLKEIRAISPSKFEDEMANLFRRLGYEVQQTPYSNDYGRDAIMSKNGEKYLLECKKYDINGTSGRPDIQKFHSAIINDKASGGFFVTTGVFSKSAIKYASALNINLIDRFELPQLIFKSNPSATDDDRYKSMCRLCGDVVQHRLRKPKAVKCTSGHSVEPSINLDRVLGNRADAPTCPKCGLAMRVVDGRNGKFWSCSGYPACRSTKPYVGAKLNYY